ncbi:MAG: hypothetical protein ACK41Y_16595 [Paracoccus hibiscisoli]|uniref:hypothetical protein n=1 Tax=Paracoccus hibiscisoli TaxID=2023261 RepID=UPI003918D955
MLLLLLLLLLLLRHFHSRLWCSEILVHMASAGGSSGSAPARSTPAFTFGDPIVDALLGLPVDLALKDEGVSGSDFDAAADHGDRCAAAAQAARRL